MPRRNRLTPIIHRGTSASRRASELTAMKEFAKTRGVLRCPSEKELAERDEYHLSRPTVGGDWNKRPRRSSFEAPRVRCE